MLTSFIITFREALEVALVVGIVLSYLIKVKQTRYNNIVYLGVVGGVVASVIGAIIFNVLAGGFTGRAEQIFEGVTMLIGAALLTTMILWMLKQKHVVKDIETRVAREVTEAHKFGLFSIAFVSVLREGIETVIFLGAASFVSNGDGLFGALLGIVVAVLLGYLIFIGSKRINIGVFFNITSVVLVLFSAGLVAHGVHEFEEAGLIPVVVEHVWDINPAVNPDGSYPLLHEKGYVGSVLKSLFGYNGDPSLLELLSYVSYLVVILFVWRRIETSRG